MKDLIERKTGFVFGHFMLFDSDFLAWFRLGNGYGDQVGLEFGALGHGFYVSRNK